MKVSSIFYPIIGCMLITFCAEAYGKKERLYCVEPVRARDGEHGIPGYTEDGGDGQDGEKGRTGVDGGNGGNGGSSIYGNGGNGGNGGDAD